MVGIGIALADPEHTWIIEPSIQVGREFIDAYNFSNAVSSEPLTSFACDLHQALIIRGVQKEEEILYVPSIYATLMQLIKQYKLHILFSTTLLKVMQDDQEVVVECNDVYGWKHIKAERYIDTIGHPSNYAVQENDYTMTLHALFYGNYTPFQLQGFQSRMIHQKNMFVIEMEVNKSFTFTSMRKRYFDFIHQLPHELAGSKLMMIANTVCIRSHVMCIIEKRSYYIPGYAYGDVYEALAKGEALGREMRC